MTSPNDSSSRTCFSGAPGTQTPMPNGAVAVFVVLSRFQTPAVTFVFVMHAPAVAQHRLPAAE
jgi:hypothetical protein